MNYEEHCFAPNSIVTYEDCPVCGAPDMRVEHGKSGRGSLQHFEHCTECGDSMPIVCYDCQYCLMEPMAGHNWLAYSTDETEANVRAKAAVKLGVPENAVEVKWIGGCWLARVRREETE